MSTKTILIESPPKYIETTIDDYGFSKFKVLNHTNYGWCIYVGWGNYLTSGELRAIANKLDYCKRSNVNGIS